MVNTCMGDHLQSEFKSQKPDGVINYPQVKQHWTWLTLVWVTTYNLSLILRSLL